MSKNAPRAAWRFPRLRPVKNQQTLSSVTTSEVSRQARGILARAKRTETGLKTRCHRPVFSPSPHFASASQHRNIRSAGLPVIPVLLQQHQEIFPSQLKQQTTGCVTPVRWLWRVQPIASVLLIISICVEPAISANTSSERISIGSTRMPSVNSRLAPTPANGLPVSSPERAKKKRNRAREDR